MTSFDAVAQAAGLAPDAFLGTLLDWYGRQTEGVQQVVLGRKVLTQDVACEQLKASIERLAALFNGPENADPHGLSAALLAGIDDVAERVGLSPEPFLRQIVAQFFDKLLSIEQGVREGAMRTPSGRVTLGDVLCPPLPVVSTPTFEVHDSKSFPQPPTNPEWLYRVDWARARREIDVGNVISFQIDPPEAEAARWVIANQLGNVAIVLDIVLFRLWVMRPVEREE